MCACTFVHTHARTCAYNNYACTTCTITLDYALTGVKYGRWVCYETGSAQILEAADPMELELNSKRVQAVTSHYSNQLLDIFAVFAATDVSLTAQAHMETMSFAEFVFLMKQSKIIDGNLTVAKMSEIFAQVNAQACDEGEKDDDADELSFDEFKNAICRCANAKIPIERRGDPPEPFEYIWQSFLQIIFLPKMKAVVKDMRKGVAKKTL